MTSAEPDLVEICTNCTKTRAPRGDKCQFVEDPDRCPIIKVVMRYAVRKQDDWSGGVGPQ